MFKFFKKRPDSQSQRNSQSGDSQPPDTIPISTQQQTNFRDLSRVVLRDILRMNGIPLDWMTCESSPRNKGDDDHLIIQLLVKRWHDGLMLYAPLIQEQLLQGMQRFDPSSDHTGHLVVWQFASDCGFDKNIMPAPDYWLTQTASPTSKPKFDLPPSSRDHKVDDFAATVPGDFQATEPGDFR